MSQILNLQKLSATNSDFHVQGRSTVSACCHSLAEDESGGGDTK